ncbi:uncharacterized protein C5orf60-like isoform X2 [Pongo abelii]|uniref:Uncharacterized protein n=1 Tax=Pongo abelii TaxID=9601 RepID=A0A8I5YLQ8_PONAB|nr:uncharacterized protein C5orf60-like isoform X2 [Pongo abelii]XP_054402965.1 uncharacterized protein C5orf60-like isoform X2 [Pongo abelii]
MPRAQLPEDSSAVDMDILFPLDSVTETELCPSPIPQIIHFVLFIVFSLVILIILCPYIPREPSSVPPREENSENDQGEVGEWLSIGNKSITLKDCRVLLKELENLEVYTFRLEKCLRKLPGGEQLPLPSKPRPPEQVVQTRPLKSSLARETPHAGRWRQEPHFPQPERANAAGCTRHQNPRHSHGRRTPDIHEQLGIS